MNTIYVIFILSFLTALLLTPCVGWIARRYRIVDSPSLRRVHVGEIPRIGGVVLFFSFFLPLMVIFFVYTDLMHQIFMRQELLWFAAGAIIIFLLGLLDDIFHLKYYTKLTVQILVVSIVFYGGLGIHGINLPGGHQFFFGLFSLPVTVFWFLMIINGINLIDGLDGLAAGVSFFASIVVLVLSVQSGNYLVAMGFAALSGSCLGFLRYNFNPASIFMGDSGSYFLGFMIAGMSILGAKKGEATVAILIPILALGAPIIDVILAPVRRFMKGKSPFMPDQEHIHHKLLAKGFDQRQATFIIYGFSIVCGVIALMIVAIRDIRAAYLLIILAVIIFVGIRKLGYFEYLAVDKFFGWLQDMKDVSGVSIARRSFLAIQLDIESAQSFNEMWANFGRAMEMLEFVKAELYINNQQPSVPWIWENPQSKDSALSSNGSMVVEGFMRVELPLMNGNGSPVGLLVMVKDLKASPLKPHTLRRIEHLRRSLNATLSRLLKLR